MRHGADGAPWTAAAAIAVLAACADSNAAPDPRELAVLAPGDQPTLEIGVLEGDSSYVFQNVAAALELPSGGVAIADAGSSEIVLYAPDGAFVRRFGGRGEGPGEFKGLTGLYAHPGDSLLAFDAWTGRVSVFDASGGFHRQMDPVSLSGDSTFAMDVWLHGRWWVEGVVDARERASVRRALDRLPTPRASPGYRVVRVARDGRLWIREPRPTGDGLRRWTVADARGQPVATIDLPDRFEPMDIRADRVLGRWRGESDVHFVRRYALEPVEGVRAAPSWVTETRVPVAVGPLPSDEELTERMRAALLGLARAQEIHYSTAMTYTALVDSLEWERPEGIDVDVVNAGTRGWVVVFTHPGLDRICGLGYGFDVPPGWPPGGMVCGPPSGVAGEG